MDVSKPLPEPVTVVIEGLSIVEPTTGNKSERGFRFWLIVISCCISLFLSALEMSAVATALPVIVDDIGGAEFVWVGTAYALASTAFLPLSGGLAEIFGRRISMISALAIFALGSALCGAAKSMNWLIAARTVQGLGGSGILSLTSIIISDLVPLQERGNYNALIGLTWSIATVIGPLIGGALSTHGQWRWLFYLNLPVCGVALCMVMLFLDLPTPPGTFRQKISRLDWIGNLIVVGSTTSFVIGLTWGGVKFSWSSAQVLAPLILGICGLFFFLFYEAKVAIHPIVPITLLQNRTSVSGYIQTFINTFVVLAVTYYLPVYYQSCKDATPIRSSVDMLGMSLMVGPVIIGAGISVTKFQVYRPQLWLAWLLMIVGMGSFTTIKADTPLSHSVGLPILVGSGAAILNAVTYFPVLSPLPVSENAHALAFFAFCRSFAGVWGISVGATVLQNELGKRLPQTFLDNLPGGRSGVELSYSVIPLIRTLPEPLKDQVRIAFGDSIVVIWQVLIGVIGIGLLASLLMRDVPMHKHVDKKWTLEEKQKGRSVESVDVVMELKPTV